MKDKIIYKELDTYKGLSILLIIMLHSLCNSPINLRGADSIHFFRDLIMFMSPNALFFFASGFLFVKSSAKYKISEFVWKKAVRLLIPMVVFSLATIFIKLQASSFVNHPIENVWIEVLSILLGRHYWFLYSLFFIFLLHKLCKGSIRLVFSCILFIASIFVVGKDSMSIIDKTIYYNAFFYVGSIVGNSSRYTVVRDYVLNNRLLTASAFTVVVIFCLFCIEQTWPINIYIQHYILPFIAISYVWLISLLLKDVRSITFLGRYSLQYYLNHLLFITASFILGGKFYGFIQNYIVVYSFIVLFTLMIATIILCLERILAKKKIFGILFGL